MIDCPNGEIRDRLPDYLHEQLVPAERARVAAHVATCAACSTELALLRELRGTWATPSVNVAKIVAALPSASREGRAGASVRGPRWRQLNWRVAAAIVVVAAGSGASFLFGGRVGGPERELTGTVRTDSAGAQQVATTAVTIDAYVSEASTAELEALLDDLESFDGLPAGEPEPAVAAPGDAEEGL